MTRRRSLVILCLVAFMYAHAFADDHASSAQLHLGERIYRDGLLPDNSPLKGYIKADVAVDGTAFSCSNCHTRSGLGSVEGQIASPPVNGAALFKPRYLFKDQIKNNISKSRGVTRPAQALRPAYTEETLADALRGGIDPAGKELSPVMPRYNLNDHDMQILVKYLQNLSSSFSPGVSDTSLTFATIVTDDVSREDRQAMLASLETLVTINQQTKTQKKLPQFAKMFRMLDNAFFRDISIKTWELRGEPSTWRAQLEAYNQKEPVFALLGGISNKPWQPIHDFCETNHIPCLFPVTDLPVISSNNWYTYYASKGYYQEGESAARFIKNSSSGESGERVLQIVRTTPQGDALASGFTTTWNEAGNGHLHTVRIDQGQKFDASALQELMRQHTPDTVVIWTGEDITAVMSGLSSLKKLPAFFVSARYTGKSFASIPEHLRETLFITYPYRLPEEEKSFKGFNNYLTLGKLMHPDEKRIVTRTFSMVHIFLQGLKELKLDFYRDTLLDVIAMRPDQLLPDYERYSFGPGQRYASKGCYIVQLDRSNTPKLIKKSDWVIF